MIVLDENASVADWIKNQNMETSGVTRIDIGTFEVAEGFETELILIEDTVYLQMQPVLLDKLNQVSAVILFRSTESLVGNYIPKIVSEISPQTSCRILANQIQFLESQIRQNNIIKSQLISLNQELIETMGDVDLQMRRVKKTYEDRAPKRLENFKALSIMSKYAAGEGVGGEFFDIFSFDSKVFILMSTCSSFLASSSIIQFFAEMKAQKSIDDASELELISKISLELIEINKSRKKNVNVELFTAIFDSSDLSLRGHNFGNFQFLSSDLEKSINIENKVLTNPEASKFSTNLNRGERVVLNSPGFQQNWNITKADFLIEELILNRQLKALDLLDEIYFNLKKKSLNGFLSFDASSIILEVKQNVIVKV